MRLFDPSSGLTDCVSRKLRALAQLNQNRAKFLMRKCRVSGEILQVPKLILQVPKPLLQVPPRKDAVPRRPVQSPRQEFRFRRRATRLQSEIPRCRASPASFRAGRTRFGFGKMWFHLKRSVVLPGSRPGSRAIFQDGPDSPGEFPRREGLCQKDKLGGVSDMSIQTP